MSFYSLPMSMEYCESLPVQALVHMVKAQNDLEIDFHNLEENGTLFARCKTSTLSPDMDFDLIFGFYNLINRIYSIDTFSDRELNALYSELTKF
ncbi:hypothetical protein BpHYR1_042888 [Brachionus plicatilis]|uniref:Uncharacterized protein n=1 Tax=Brachionus plicatilis TaxID=10195 RepID=A0A3M7RK63_BRAPC|nr:hypothetical protein BpHYR1_042888 [Brachionus plicatilis]